MIASLESATYATSGINEILIRTTLFAIIGRFVTLDAGERPFSRKNRRCNLAINKPVETPAFNAALPEDCAKNDCAADFKDSDFGFDAGRGKGGTRRQNQLYYPCRYLVRGDSCQAQILLNRQENRRHYLLLSGR